MITVEAISWCIDSIFVTLGGEFIDETFYTKEILWQLCKQSAM